VYETNHRHRRLLSARGERPRCLATEQGDELAPHPHFNDLVGAAVSGLD